MFFISFRHPPFESMMRRSAIVLKNCVDNNCNKDNPIEISKCRQFDFRIISNKTLGYHSVEEEKEQLTRKFTTLKRGETTSLLKWEIYLEITRSSSVFCQLI